MSLLRRGRPVKVGLAFVGRDEVRRAEVFEVVVGARRGRLAELDLALLDGEVLLPRFLPPPEEFLGFLEFPAVAQVEDGGVLRGCDDGREFLDREVQVLVHGGFPRREHDRGRQGLRRLCLRAVRAHGVDGEVPAILFLRGELGCWGHLFLCWGFLGAEDGPVVSGGFLFAVPVRDIARFVEDLQLGGRVSVCYRLPLKQVIVDLESLLAESVHDLDVMEGFLEDLRLQLRLLSLLLFQQILQEVFIYYLATVH